MVTLKMMMVMLMVTLKMMMISDCLLSTNIRMVMMIGRRMIMNANINRLHITLATPIWCDTIGVTFVFGVKREKLMPPVMITRRAPFGAQDPK